MTKTDYLAVANDTFPYPPYPGAIAKIVAGMTAAHIPEAKWTHVEATRVYCTYHNVDQAFKKLFLDAFEDPFLNAPIGHHLTLLLTC
jgi:hypothetical protein